MTSMELYWKWWPLNSIDVTKYTIYESPLDIEEKAAFIMIIVVRK